MATDYRLSPYSWFYALQTLWQFSRPHTLVGSTVSILSLYAVAARDGGGWMHLSDLLMPSLISALACNIYITGLNQWSDVAIDRINKPWLPIPAGRLSRENALRIVLISGALAFLIAAAISLPFFFLILVIALIGTAYSLPPLKFKRNHFLAASAITIVRGLLVNLGFYLHFKFELYQTSIPDAAIWPITIFVVLFSLGIAWFKDIPDTDGDNVHEINTLALKLGRKPALIAGVAVVSAAYGAVITFAGWGLLPNSGYFSLIHGLALLGFVWRAFHLNVADNKAVKRFYMFFWILFFCEYILYAIGFYL